MSSPGVNPGGLIGHGVTTPLLKSLDDVSSITPTVPVAETSRPYRHFKKVQAEKKRTTRPRQEGPHSPAVRVNWQAPNLWTMIDKAARVVGYPWSPTEIVKHLQRKSPELFRTLAVQRISEWRDRTVTRKLVWTDDVLKRVARGHRQGFDTTRRSILVRSMLARVDEMVHADTYHL